MGLDPVKKKIGVFSHGGTKNLGDEALLAAVIQNVKRRIPAADVIAFTINPVDTQQRHGVSAFPIRRFNPPAPQPHARTGETPTQAAKAASAKPGIKATLKKMPGLRPALAGLRKFAANVSDILYEPKFLTDAYRSLKGVDLLLVAGSQQLNDGYGGAWGFPFTLYKWTWLAKLTRTKVAILSVGAGPIDSALSKWFFRRVL